MSQKEHSNKDKLIFQIFFLFLNCRKLSAFLMCLFILGVTFTEDIYGEILNCNF